MIEVSILGVSFNVDKYFNFIAVDDCGEVWTYSDYPEKGKDGVFWFVDDCDCRNVGLIDFSSNEERKLCKTKVWEIK